MTMALSVGVRPPGRAEGRALIEINDTAGMTRQKITRAIEVGLPGDKD